MSFIGRSGFPGSYVTRFGGGLKRVFILTSFSRAFVVHEFLVNATRSLLTTGGGPRCGVTLLESLSQQGFVKFVRPGPRVSLHDVPLHVAVGFGAGITWWG